MIVLDTNVVSELMKPTPDAAVQDWLMRMGDTPLSTTAVTISEIEFGLRRLPDGRRREALHQRFEAFADALTVLSLDEWAARETGRLRALRATAGLTSHPSDMMIAGIVSVAGAILATRNTRDFAGLPIQILDPWATRD